MRRLSREALRTRIWVALSVLKSPVKRQLGVDSELTRRAVTDDLVNRIMGQPASETVMLMPDMVGSGHAPWHGRWDVDEPHPHPDLPFASY